MSKKNKIILILFLLTIFCFPRLYIIFYRSLHNNNSADILLYAHYNIDYINSLHSKQNFYVFSYVQQQKRLKILNKQYNFKNNNNSLSYFEYPPLALQWIVLPGRILTTWVNFTKIENSYQVFCNLYSLFYRVQCFILELVMYFIFLLLLLKTGNTIKMIFISALLYSFSTLTLFPLIYERIDIVVAFFIFISILLLLFAKKYLSSSIYLAVAICFKLTPVILVPIWILTSIKQKYFTQPVLFCFESIKKIILFIGFITLISVPFLFAYGIKSFYFFSYHFKRGIQIESVYSNLLMIIYKLEGIHNFIYFDYGSFNIKELFSFRYGVLIICLFILLSVIFFSLFLILRKERLEAKVRAFLIFRFIFLTFLVFLCFSKVFSPQFIIWLIPVLGVELIIAEKKLISYLLAFSIAVTSYLYYVYGLVAYGTSLGILILSIRNICLILMIALIITNIYQIILQENIMNSNNDSIDARRKVN